MSDAPFKVAHSPGTPLFPLSPERVNGTRPPHGGNVPQSPSMPEFVKPSDFSLTPGSPKRSSHNRTNSEALVQGMVARFDSLSLKDHQQMHKRDEVAIRREQMAREMAELELSKTKRERAELEVDNKKYREEYRRLKKDMEESKERERKLMKRLAAQEDVIERSSQTQEHQKTLLEKEVRKLRKEAYKTQSVLLKTQEELKSTRNSLRITQSGLETEKSKSFKREQEAFTAEYKLIGLAEEATKLQERLKILEEERDALKTSLHEEEVARVAAEGRIALPDEPDDEDDEFASPKKSPRKKMIDLEDKENVTPVRSARYAETKVLQEELALQRRLRHKAEDQVEFMKMECQFLCCSCRVAEQRGTPYVHDASFADEMERLKVAPSVPLPQSPLPKRQYEEIQIGPGAQNDDGEETTLSTTPSESQSAGEADRDMAYSPASGTFRPIVEAKKEPIDDIEPAKLDAIEEVMPDAPQQQPVLDEEVDDVTVIHNTNGDLNTMGPVSEPPKSPAQQLSSESSDTLPPHTPRVPHTPKYREVRTVTTTTTIPLAFTPSSNDAPLVDLESAPQTPATIGHPPVYKMPASPFPGPGTPGALRPDGTLDREAALEQIRLRRGRARSVAMGLGTPRKQMMEGIARRDISAPALKGRG